MNRLTPNMWAYSTFNGDEVAAAPVVETRELDFNLARRSAIIINRIIGQMFLKINTTSGHALEIHIVQELDTDPDNIDVEFQGDVDPEAVVLDSSRVFRQVHHGDRDTAAGVNGPRNSNLIKDFADLEESKRPISITPLRHHVAAQVDTNYGYNVEINIDYFIVELSLQEIGIINASRR